MTAFLEAVRWIAIAGTIVFCVGTAATIFGRRL